MSYQDLLVEIKQEFPDFQLMRKEESPLMKGIDTFLKILSFGKNKAFMDDFVTTINNTVYVSTKWDSYTDHSKSALLRHERVHMRQAKQYGFLIFSLLYLFAWFPLFFATYRTKFEQEAYEETIKAHLEYYGTKVILTSSHREAIISYFTSSAYGWMCPFRSKIETWYDNYLKTLLAEHNNNQSNV